MYHSFPIWTEFGDFLPGQLLWHGLFISRTAVHPVSSSSTQDCAIHNVASFWNTLIISRNIVVLLHTSKLVAYISKFSRLKHVSSGCSTRKIFERSAFPSPLNSFNLASSAEHQSSLKVSHRCPMSCCHSLTHIKTPEVFVLRLTLPQPSIPSTETHIHIQASSAIHPPFMTSTKNKMPTEPPTPRRGRPMGTRSTPRRASPPPAGPTFRDQFMGLPPFFLGMLCATLLILAGFSIAVPGVGQVDVGVSPVAAETPDKVRNEHMRLRKACGLPALHNFRCRNGEFQGENDPITDLKCDIKLSAVREGVTVAKTIQVMNQTWPYGTPADGTKLKESLKTIQPPLYMRWMDHEQSNVTSFSLRKNILRPHLTDPNLRKWYAENRFGPMLKYQEDFHLRRFLELDFSGDMTWSMSIERNAIDDRMWTSTNAVKDEAYPAQLQYICIGDTPTLALKPVDGCKFQHLHNPRKNC